VQDVVLGDAGDPLLAVSGSAFPLTGDLEGLADHPFRAPAGDDPGVHRHLGGAGTAQLSPDPRVQVFGVLPDDDHVDLVRVPHLDGEAVDLVRDAGVELDRSDVGVQVEGRSGADHRAPPGHVPVGHGHRTPNSLGVGPAHGSEKDHVCRGDPFLATLGPVSGAVLQVELPSAGDFIDLEADAERVSGSVEHPKALPHHLNANAVTGERCDLVGHGRLHVCKVLLPGGPHGIQVRCRHSHRFGSVRDARACGAACSRAPRGRRSAPRRP